MRTKFLLLSLILASAVCDYAPSVNQAKESTQTETSQTVTTQTGSSQFGTTQIVTTHTNIMKFYEIVDILNQRVEKLENNSSGVNIAIDVSEIKANVKDLIKNTEFLFELVKTISNQKTNCSKNDNDTGSELRSHCTSLCEAKVKYWERETSAKFKDSLRQVDFCAQNTSKACDPNPCLNGGRCELLSTGSGYRCAGCPYLTSGTNCENWNCSSENRCWRNGNTMYVVFEEHGYWTQAKDKCAREGMRMAMPKDKDTTEFLITQLKSVYRIEEYKHWYIGLKTVRNVWLWNDGTPLVDYAGNYPNFKSNLGERWAILWLHGGAMFWYPQIHEEIAKRLYFPLCERTVYTR